MIELTLGGPPRGDLSIVDSADAGLLRGLARAGDLAAFEATIVDFSMKLPAQASTLVAQHLAQCAEQFDWHCARGRCRWRGSLLLLASELPRLAAMPGLREVAHEVERALRARFDLAAPLLLDQRSITVGAAGTVGVVAFETRASHPGIARLAWGVGTPLEFRWKDALALGDSEGAAALRPIESWAALELGEYLGPTLRFEAWVDQQGWDRSRELRQRWAGLASGDAVADCLACFTEAAMQLGMALREPALAVEPAPITSGTDYLRPALFVRALIDGQPLFGKKGTRGTKSSEALPNTH